jgi:hypothetical protein
MLILSLSSFIQWVFVKLFIAFCIITVIGMVYIFLGSLFSSKIRDKYMRF